MSEGPSIQLSTLATWARLSALAAALAAVSWASVEVGLTERRARDAFLDQGGAIRSVACSADGRVIYISAATGVIASADGGKSFVQIFPPPPPQAPQQAPQAPPGPTPPSQTPDAPKAPGGTAGRS